MLRAMIPAGRAGHCVTTVGWVEPFARPNTSVPRRRCWVSREGRSTQPTNACPLSASPTDQHPRLRLLIDRPDMKLVAIVPFQTPHAAESKRQEGCAIEPRADAD